MHAAALCCAPPGWKRCEAGASDRKTRQIVSEKTLFKICEKKSWIYFRKNTWQHIKKQVHMWDQTGTYALKLMLLVLVPVHQQAEIAAKLAHQTEKLVKSSRLQLSVERWE